MMDATKAKRTFAAMSMPYDIVNDATLSFESIIPHTFIIHFIRSRLWALANFCSIHQPFETKQNTQHTVSNQVVPLEKFDSHGR